MNNRRVDIARTLLVNFTRLALEGEVPRAPADAGDYRRVANALTRAPVFLASTVAKWDESERRALFEMLAGAITELQKPASCSLEAAELDESTPHAVGVRFARWLIERHDEAQRDPARSRAWTRRSSADARQHLHS